MSRMRGPTTCICEFCGAKALEPDNHAAPDGWGEITLRAYSFKERCYQHIAPGVGTTTEICIDCVAQLSSIIAILRDKRGKP